MKMYTDCKNWPVFNVVKYTGQLSDRSIATLCSGFLKGDSNFSYAVQLKSKLPFAPRFARYAKSHRTRFTDVKII